MNIPAFFDREISDEYVADNFRKLKEFFRAETPFLGFSHYEVTLDSAVTDFEFTHNLSFQPQDAFVTFISNDATMVFKFDQFTKDLVVFSTSAACTVRFFLGSYSSIKR
jgi:hypothetical protein